VYAGFLPKHTHPFVYLSLSLAPKNVDVNVHPTKREVHFLHEDKIVELVSQSLEQALAGANSSRVFHTQALLPGAGTPSSSPTSNKGKPTTASPRVETKETKANLASPRLLGDDDDIPPLSAGSSSSSSGSVDSSNGNSNEGRSPAKRGTKRPNQLVREDASSGRGSMAAYLQHANNQQRSNSILGKVMAAARQGPTKRAKRRGVSLTSIHSLITAIDGEAHVGLAELLRGHTYVAAVDDTYSLLQHKTKLYLVHVSGQSSCYHVIIWLNSSSG
jgi:DNA mismatch repair protein MLH1